MIRLNVNTAIQIPDGLDIHQPVHLPATSTPNAVLRTTKKGGVLGKKRGKYKKDSRVTQWRHRAKAKAQEQSTTVTTTPSTTLGLDTTSPSQEQISPSSGYSSPDDPVPVPLDTPTPDIKPVETLIANLTLQLSHVKNQRICPYSAYDALRHLSVLRFLEHTLNGRMSEHDAATRLAEILWVPKPSPTRDPNNSINHTSLLIRQWAKEYRAKGELSEHTHGTHVKTTSKLANAEIAMAAQRELGRMTRPNPAALKIVLLDKVFPEFGVSEPKLTENTCRIYMEKWGWKWVSAYREWVPRGKRAIHAGSSESDEGTTASEGTSIIENDAVHVQPTTAPTKPPPWNAPIPSPTTVLTSSPTKPAILSHVSQDYCGLQSGTMNTTASAGFTSDSAMNIPQPVYSGYTSTPPEFQQPSYISYPFDTSQLYNFDIPQPSMNPVQSPNSQRSPYHEQAPQRGYTYKSLDHLVADPPEMMGHRPAFNGLPITSFIPPASSVAHFSHDNSFPSQMPRRRTSTNYSTTLPEPSNSGPHHFIPPHL